MSSTVAKALPEVPRKTVKASLDRGVEPLKTVQSGRVVAGQLVKSALAKSGMSQKEAAITMGISEAQFSGQLAGTSAEHLSWQRMQQLPDAFFTELLILLAESRGIARVRMQLDIERKTG